MSPNECINCIGASQHYCYSANTGYEFICIYRQWIHLQSVTTWWCINSYLFTIGLSKQNLHLLWSSQHAFSMKSMHFVQKKCPEAISYRHDFFLPFLSFGVNCLKQINVNNLMICQYIFIATNSDHLKCHESASWCSQQYHQHWLFFHRRAHQF